MEKNKFKFNSDQRKRAEKILDRLRSELELSWPSKNEPFLILVETVLSQNTNRQNTKKASEALTSKFSSPSELSRANVDEIQKLIKPAGLYKRKSKNLKELAEIILKKYSGKLDSLLEKPSKKAREELQRMPGVGPKTADCVLLFAGGYDVLPVDTHVARTAKRFGFANLKDNPEKVKKKLEPLIPDKRRGEVHLLLIELGRNFCKALNPKCKSCPLRDLCPKNGL